MPQDIAASYNVCNYGSPEVGFAGRKPRRRCGSQDRLAFTTHCVVLNRRSEVPIHLLEPHPVEDLLVVLGLLLGPLAFRLGPEPIEEKNVVGDEAVYLLGSHSAGDFVVPSVGRTFCTKTLAADALQKHVAPHCHANILLTQIGADARDVLSVPLSDIAISTLRTQPYGSE